MYEIPKFMYDDRIYKCIDDMIDMSTESVGQLKEDDRDAIVTKIIDVLGTDAYQVIIGSDNFDKTLHHFSNFLKTANCEDAYKLLNRLRMNALDHYEYDIEQLFIEIVQQRQRDKKGL